jgi:hypothetical protein
MAAEKKLRRPSGGRRVGVRSWDVRMRRAGAPVVSEGWVIVRMEGRRRDMFIVFLSKSSKTMSGETVNRGSVYESEAWNVFERKCR